MKLELDFFAYSGDAPVLNFDFKANSPLPAGAVIVKADEELERLPSGISRLKKFVAISKEEFLTGEFNERSFEIIAKSNEGTLVFPVNLRRVDDPEVRPSSLVFLKNQPTRSIRVFSKRPTDIPDVRYDDTKLRLVSSNRHESQEFEFLFEAINQDGFSENPLESNVEIAFEQAASINVPAFIFK